MRSYEGWIYFLLELIYLAEGWRSDRRERGQARTNDSEDGGDPHLISP